jgi:hypothetical protein
MTGVAWHRYELLAIRNADSGRILLPDQSWLVLSLVESNDARFMMGKNRSVLFFQSFKQS